MSDFGSRPRSTPIPGSGAFVADPELPGNSAAPPSPTEFVNSQTFAAPPPGGARPALPGMHAAPGADDFQFVPLGRRRRKRGVGWFLMVLLIAAGPLAGIGVGIWAVFKAMDAVDQATDLSDQTLSARDRAALGLVGDEETLFEGAAPGRVAAFFDTQLPGEPTRFTEILLHPDYAFATVQDPNLPANLDQYQFRSAKIGAKSPQTSVDDVESMLFSAGQINWVAVAQVAEQAPRLVEVADGHVSHIIVNHSAFAPTHAAVVRIYVTGARGSGFLELAPTGEILAAH
jgi:hypothetical protein